MASNSINVVQVGGEEQKKLTGADMKVGEIAITPLNYYVIRTLNSLVFLEDGSSSNLKIAITKIFPKGTIINIRVGN